MKTNNRRMWRWLIVGLLSGALATVAWTYEQYSGGFGGGCIDCHGDFRGTDYTSLSDGQGWGFDLHLGHEDFMLAGDCDTCHTSGGRTPVFLGSSNGGAGFDPIGCAGCHGRAEDGTGVGTEGYSAGLRQHHFVSGTTLCVNCHSDSDPANKTTVGEDVAPPYYFLPDSSHPSKPTDPCNPAPGLPEDYHGSTLGQDNDGDGVYDEADSDCSTAAATPGETSSRSLLPLLVTAHDPIAGTMTLSYDTACAVTDHTLEFGALANVSSYVYDGQECDLGTSGTYVWTYPAGDTFFLIVGNDGSVEGSYGTDAAGVERPEDVGSTCPIPQQLSDRCDP